MKTNKEFERKVGDLEKTVGELERNNKQMERTKKDLEKNVEDLEKTAGELEWTNKQMERTARELEKTNKEMEKINEEMEKTNRENDKTNKEMEDTVWELERTNAKLTKTVVQLENEFNLFRKNMKINEAKIKKIENQTKLMQAKAELRSNMCAVRGGRHTTGGDLTYTWLTLDDNNIVGASFDIDRGVYIAGVSGTYRIEFYAEEFVAITTGGPATCQNQLRIHHNGATCDGCAMGNWISWTPHVPLISIPVGVPGGRSLMLHMETGDLINVHAEQICELYNIMLCVSYLNP